VIIDCDTHLMPRDAFESVRGGFEASKPAPDLLQVALKKAGHAA